jgi:CzcA family heavy metal efflux pump
VTAPPAPRGLQAALIGFAIRFRGVITALTITLLAYGAYTLPSLSYDVFPEFAPPQVGIQTEAPGLSPEQVETLVTQPIENALGGAPGVETLRSTSIQGLSVITVLFGEGGDLYRDREIVAERLASAARRLPPGIAPPTLSPLASSTSTVLILGLTAGRADVSQIDLRDAADWTLRPRLLAVPGVANAAVFGGEVAALRIGIDPARLARFDLSLDDVLAAARQASALRGAGFIETPNQRLVLAAEGQTTNAALLAGRLVARGAAGRVALGDVAEIGLAPLPPFGAGSIMGEPGAVIVVSAQYGANTVEVTERALRAIAGLRADLAARGITLHDDLFRPADFIRTAIGNVGASLVLGGVLVIVVLFLFLFDLRTAAISCLAIPLSLLAAVLVLQRFGVDRNTMTLGGLAIAIGEVVDDAVIDVENITRRLRENRAAAAPRPASDVVLAASLEVRGAVVHATFIVVLVFLPILALPGLAGRFFAPLGLAYILAILASLLIALTVTPALAMLLLVRRRDGRREPPVIRFLRRRYERLLLAAMRHGRAVMAATLLATAAGCAALPFFAGAFLPELNEGHLVLHVASVPGTSIAESLRLGRLISRAVAALPVVRVVAQRVGRAELSEDTWGPEYSEFDVDLRPGLSSAEAARASADLRAILQRFKGVSFAITPFLTERIEETLSGYTAPLVINIFGHDLDALDQTGAAITRLLASMPGVTDVTLQAPPGAPEIAIHLRPEDLLRTGLTAGAAIDAIAIAYQGETLGAVADGNRVRPLVALLAPEYRHDIATVSSLPLRTADGGEVLLGQVADIFEREGRAALQHSGARRVQTVTAAITARDANGLAHAIAARLAQEITLPSGTYLELAGTAVAEARATQDLVLRAVLAGIAVLALLWVVTGNARNLLLILTNLPFALVGGVLAVFASGGVLTLGATVGFVTLFGITLRNAIMMISHYEYLVSVDRLPWGARAALLGAGDRLAPIVMTSLVTALGLSPLVFGMGDPGREIEGPMALVILGGLVSSMALNLLVLPILAWRFGRFGSSRADSL